MKYITRHVRTRGLAQLVVDFELYTAMDRIMFYYIRENMLVQT